ncbi:chorismate mutase [uncultured Corynebacterium sp.]|uniref:chorismate mutase n=1 Tax=uncultured Corynebacterium sp. TaxID=159447 RepID=UPI0025FB2AB0|nr:chorismate mutase [uncultured Corynebacterium sp.]
MSEPSKGPENEAVTSPLSSGTDDPLSDAEIQAYRLEINELDRTIIGAASRRSEVSRIIGKTRKASGGTKLVYARETAILNEYRDALGQEGVAIANALLQLGRGRLGQ